MSIEKTKNSLRGERIKEVREKSGLNQADFGKRLGYSQDAISLAERTGDASDRLLREICRVFNVKRNWLTEGVGSIYNDPPSAHGQVVEVPNMYINEKRKNLVRKVKELMLDQATEDKIVEALLTTVEAFEIKTGKGEDKDK